MIISRRYFLALTSCIAFPMPTQGRPGNGLSKVLEIGEILTQIADGLDSLAETVGSLTVRIVNGSDWLRGRSVRRGLVELSGRLSDLVADQQNVRIALDTYGDEWRRRTGKGTLTQADKVFLTARWRQAVEKVTHIASRTATMLRDVKTIRSDVNLDDSYAELKDLLAAASGPLAEIASGQAPMDRDDINALIENEEAFLHLRASLKETLKAVRAAIRRL